MKGRGDTKDRESTGGPGSDVEEVFLVVEDEDELERCPNFVVEVVWEPTGIGGGGAGKERRKERGKEDVLVVEVKDGEMMKYKKAANRTKPVATTLPEEYCIVRHKPPDHWCCCPSYRYTLRTLHLASNIHKNIMRRMLSTLGSLCGQRRKSSVTISSR